MDGGLMMIDEETIDRIEMLARKATRGPWLAGGPVKRESITKVLTGGSGPNGLSREVWEVGHEDDEYPPGICVVNRYKEPGTETETEARDNAEYIAAADPTTILELCRLARMGMGREE